MSPTGTLELVTVLGHPGHRRVAGFRSAAAAAGIPTTLLTWADVVAGRLPDRLGRARIDSPGEDADVDRALRALGGGGRALEHGEVAELDEWYAGLLTAAGRVCHIPAARPDTSLADLSALFDKRLTRSRLSAAGVPVPGAAPAGLDGDLTADPDLADLPPGRWFVKPAFGSSAVAVHAVAVGRTGTLRMLGHIEHDPATSRLHATLRPQAHSGPTARRLLARLADAGTFHVERWLPKATLGDRALDLRVVVIGGVARHTVVRTSRGPITNLHLGNARGDLDAVRTRLGGPGWEAAMETCERAAACFPATPTVGVDLLIGADWRCCAVAEVNAFGDLLPGVLHDGQDTYAAQAHLYQGAAT